MYHDYLSYMVPTHIPSAQSNTGYHMYIAELEYRKNWKAQPTSMYSGNQGYLAYREKTTDEVI